MSVTNCLDCACREKRMRELVTRVAELEGTMKPSFRCPKCNSARKVPKCFKCGEATVSAADGWEEPKLPPIERIRELAREVGYAVGVHGSLERDCDLIAAPWTDCAVGNYALMKHIADGIGAKILEISRKPLGRYAATIQMDGYFKQIDLSVCPALDSEKGER